MVAAHVSDKDFEDEVIKSDIPVLVDFYAEWCGPCKMMAPVIDELADELKDKHKIVKLNVDENPETAQKYQVMSIPTLIFIKDGELVDQLVGAQSKETLIDKLNGML
jgi:thioredoxin 1